MEAFDFELQKIAQKMRYDSLDAYVDTSELFQLVVMELADRFTGKMVHIAIREFKESLSHYMDRFNQKCNMFQSEDGTFKVEQTDRSITIQFNFHVNEYQNNTFNIRISI